MIADADCPHKNRRYFGDIAKGVEKRFGTLIMH